MIITIARTQNFDRHYAGRKQWVWSYSYIFSEDVTTPKGHTYRSGQEIEYGKGLADLRALLKRTYPTAIIKQLWEDGQ